MCYDCVGVKGMKYGAEFFTHKFPEFFGGSKERRLLHIVDLFTSPYGRCAHTATY